MGSTIGKICPMSYAIVKRLLFWWLSRGKLFFGKFLGFEVWVSFETGVSLGEIFLGVRKRMNNGSEMRILRVDCVKKRECLIPMLLHSMHSLEQE